MLFNSLQFAIFFPLVVSIFFVLPLRGQQLWLLLASCVFYAAFIPAYLWILAGLIVVDFAAGRLIEAFPSKRKAWLLGSVVANLGVLCAFKYLGFTLANLESLANALGFDYTAPIIGLLLPLGLSFHVFQSLSYVIEVYRGRSAERNLLVYALYVMFWPQLVAGPIERPTLLDQLRVRKRFDETLAGSGLKLMAWGFFKKLVVADNLARFVDPVFTDPRQFGGATLIAAIEPLRQGDCRLQATWGIAVRREPPASVPCQPPFVLDT